MGLGKYKNERTNYEHLLRRLKTVKGIVGNVHGLSIAECSAVWIRFRASLGRITCPERLGDECTKGNASLDSSSALSKDSWTML